ncbi:uncharacterized protein LOC128549066 [Mercenaria mercenaria]|uniref:uncharacterized protein LOC128549066 n=1 Tax=Mercenaria mercenaria TaxID=6596 RepID=UPI00234EE552|nr:uncharacterized protein LOC128549066 [Mercenaria mercenaria]
MSSNIENTAYYQRIMSMYIDLGTETVLQVFLWLLSTTGYIDTKTFLNKCNTILSDLKKKGILSQSEYNKLRTADPNPETFDITLLMKLITHLFSNTVAVPSRAPQPTEYSLGSDLYRLRKFRNKLVHEPTSQISKDRFEYLWNKISTVLERVVQDIDPGATEELQNKISRYKQMPLDPDDIAIKAKLERLKEWKCERNRLKEQTEDLLQKATGYQLLLKHTPVQFMRYIRLLFDGGKLRLIGILERECESASKLVHVVLRECSDTSTTEETEMDPYSMDVAVLASAILDTFKTSKTLSSEEIKRITCLKDARNLYAETALSSVGDDTSDFFKRWTDLIHSLLSLSAGLGGTTQVRCNDMIEQYTKMEDIEDNKTYLYLNQLKQHGTEVKSFEELYKENIDGLKQLLRQMTEGDDNFLKAHAIEIKIVTLCESKEKKTEAEDRLENAFNAALNTCPGDSSTGQLKTEVDKFKQKISKHSDVKVVGIKRNCILMILTCSTCEGMLHVLDYIESQGFQESMNNIADELAFMFGEPFAVRGHLTLESICAVLNDPRGAKVEGEGGITLPIECSSTEGIGHVLTVLGDGDTTNSVNHMAEILTHHLNERISLKIFPDLKGFRDLFDETDTDTSGSGSLSYEEENGEESDNIVTVTHEENVSERKDITAFKDQSPTEKAKDETVLEKVSEDCSNRIINQDSCQDEQMAEDPAKKETLSYVQDDENVSSDCPEVVFQERSSTQQLSEKTLLVPLKGHKPNQLKTQHELKSVKHVTVENLTDILEKIKQTLKKITEIFDEMKTKSTRDFNPEYQMVVLFDEIQMLLSRLVTKLDNDVLLWKDMFKRQYAGLGTCPDLKNLGRWCAETGRIMYDLLWGSIPVWFNVLVDCEHDIAPLERCKENLGNLLYGFIASTFLVTRQHSCVAKLEQKYLPELVVRILALDKCPQHTEEIIAEILCEDDVVSCIDSGNDDFQYEVTTRVQEAENFLSFNKVHFAFVDRYEYAAHFRRLKLKNKLLHRGKREQMDEYEDKYRFIFTTTIYGKEFETVSLPFVLTDVPDQEILGQASIMWQYFLTKLSCQSPHPLSDLPWHLVEQMLQSALLRLCPSRPLTEENLMYLKQRLLGAAIADEWELVSFKKFCQDNIDWSEDTHEKTFTSCSFWKWFVGIYNLIDESFLHLWEDGLIVGFISTNEARTMLEKLDNAKSGSYILRFSEQVTDVDDMNRTFGQLKACVMVVEDNNGQREKTFYDIEIGGPEKFRTKNLVNILQDINETKQQQFLYLYPGELTMEMLTEKYCNQVPQRAEVKL